VEQSVITRTVTVAPGRFAPGHLGELTQQIPFEMVDAALAQTGRTQARLRDLPARVVVYLLLAGCLHAGMLVLCDRNLTTAALTGRIAATGAQLLGRCKTNRQLPVVGRLPDGSWLSVLGGVQVRVVDAQITIATRTGRANGSYRLATTLTDAHRWPATALVALFHQRWEIETVGVGQVAGSAQLNLAPWRRGRPPLGERTAGGGSA
jgi:Insertion element 4 transposase N-terminal